ncbi:MAG TPA: hypothetical protein VF868_04180 [Bacteroidia bacterium]|jgi:mono/diheme cytochrome c family protein
MKKTLILLSAFGLIASCTFDKGEIPVKEAAGECDSTVSYSTQIAPLMTTYCNGCHISGGSGNGDFTTYAGLKQKVDNGSAHNRVVVVKDMPVPGSPTPSAEERKLIDCWIKQGAPDN